MEGYRFLVGGTYVTWKWVCHDLLVYKYIVLASFMAIWSWVEDRFDTARKSAFWSEGIVVLDLGSFCEAAIENM